MPQPKGSNGMSLNGHLEHVVLSEVDKGFDVTTLSDAHGQWGEVIARRRAMNERMDKEEATLWHQAGAAIARLLEEVAEGHRHAVEARRIADERLERLGVAA